MGILPPEQKIGDVVVVTQIPRPPSPRQSGPRCLGGSHNYPRKVAIVQKALDGNIAMNELLQKQITLLRRFYKNLQIIFSTKFVVSVACPAKASVKDLVLMLG